MDYILPGEVYMSRLVGFLVLTCFLLISGMTNQAQAAFLVEPFFDHALSGEVTAGGNDSDMSVTTEGLRLGMTSLGFMYGVEFSIGNTRYDTDPEIDATSQDLGLFLGYTFPVMLRVWATYYTSSKISYDDEEHTGTGTKIGVGYSGLPYVSINLQMLNRSYSDDIEDNATLLGISVPLTF
jgi:hypothetical protein